MNLRIRGSLITLVAFILSSAVAFSQTTATAHKVVFALTSSDSADWDLTIGNIRNLLIAFPAEALEVEVVAYGPGLSFVRSNSIAAARIEELEVKHVSFLACENSMRMQHVTHEDLIRGVETVPSGVAEVVSKEEQGWSYIKAGR